MNTLCVHKWLVMLSAVWSHPPFTSYGWPQIVCGKHWPTAAFLPHLSPISPLKAELTCSGHIEQTYKAVSWTEKQTGMLLFLTSAYTQIYIQPPAPFTTKIIPSRDCKLASMIHIESYSRYSNWLLWKIKPEAGRYRHQYKIAEILTKGEYKTKHHKIFWGEPILMKSHYKNS